MIKQVAFAAANRFAVFRAAGEKKRRFGRLVLSKNRKHSALIIVLEMKKAIPGDEAVEWCIRERSCACLRQSLACRKSLTTKRYHGLGAVETHHFETMLDRIFRDRHAASAAEIEN